MTARQYYARIDGTDYECTNFESEFSYEESIDSAKFSLAKSNNSNVSIGDEIKLGYYDSTDTLVVEFAGYVTSKSKNELLDCEAESYLNILTREIALEQYQDKTPEYIAEDLINKYTDLTYASTESSGITLSKFNIHDELLIDAFKRLIELTDWQLRDDNNKNVYFESKGTTRFNTTLTVGSNCYLNSTWKENPNRIINKVVLEGGKATFNKEETFTASASQTTFTLSYEPSSNVRVTVDGTEQKGGLEGKTSNDDYEINEENKQIIFNTGLTGGEEVIITYEYSVPIKITYEDEDSIENYNGTFAKKIQKKAIRTMSDARRYVQKILSTFGTPTKEAQLIVPYSSSITVGNLVKIVDTFNDIDEDLVVSKISINYSEGTKQITVGTPALDILNWHRNIDERLKNLETSKDNADILQKYLQITDKLGIEIVRSLLTIKSRTIGNTFYLDHSVNSLLDDTSLSLDWQGSSWSTHYEDQVEQFPTEFGEWS